MKHFTYYMQRIVHEGGNMQPDEAAKRLRSMFDQWESFCDIRFKTAPFWDADIKIQFTDHEDMCRRTAGPLCGLGLAYIDHRSKVGAGTVLWDWSRSFGQGHWAYESQHAHEIGHLFRMDHDDTIEHGTKVIMHPHGGADWFDGDFIARFQRWAGTETVKTWIPMDRKFAADDVKRLKSLRIAERDRRNQLIAAGKRNSAKAANARMHKIMEKEIAAAKRWHKINNYWRRLNLVGCHIA